MTKQTKPHSLPQSVVDYSTTKQQPVHDNLAQANTIKHNLSPRQKRFADAYLRTGNGIQAIKEAGYKPTNDASAASMATSRKKNKAIQSYLYQHSDLAEHVLEQAMTDWQHSDTPRKREIALDAAKYVHDKVHGRSTQKVQVQQSIVRVNIDLSSTEAVQDS